GFDFWFFSLPSDQIAIDVTGVETFDDLIATASQNGRDVTFQFSEEDSLTLRRTDLFDLEADMFSFV
ncbi:hypothetical protein SLH49_22190, partial [Cognatiyoonia sp. IB215446]|uniref:hypothetical protein n=1 Tax=Cognatiyoonia sp. IB215446 TaxID=3097355 RepID=UPI002A1600A0